MVFYFEVFEVKFHTDPLSQSLSQDRPLSTIFLHHKQPLLVPTLVYLAPVVPTVQHRTHARWSRKRLTNTTEVRSNPTERACVPATTASPIPACVRGARTAGPKGVPMPTEHPTELADVALAMF